MLMVRIWRSMPSLEASRPARPAGPTRARPAAARPRGRGCAGCSGAPRRSAPPRVPGRGHHQKYRPSSSGASWVPVVFSLLDSFLWELSGWTATRGRRAARVSVEATRRRGCRAASASVRARAARAPCARRLLMLIRRRCPWSTRSAARGSAHGTAGGATAQRRGAASGSAAACAAPQRLGGARAVRSGWAGGAYRGRRGGWWQASVLSRYACGAIPAGLGQRSRFEESKLCAKAV